MGSIVETGRDSAFIPWYECKVCGAKFGVAMEEPRLDAPNYCPNCGTDAKMGADKQCIA